MSKLKHTLPLLLLAGTSQLHAADEVIAPLIVSATRTAQSTDETLSSVTVISRQDIEQSPTQEVAEILAQQAGIAIARTGGPGAQTNVYLRGGDSGHALILIDGVRASSATLGQFAWETLRAEQIERIEVVRGPRASLYGSDAISGVIHIFTRQTEGAYVETTVGSMGTRELRAGVSTGEKWQLSVNGGISHSDGIPTLKSDSEDRAFDNRNATLRLKGEVNANTDLNLSLTQSEGTSEHDAFTGDSDFTNRTASLRLEHRRGSWEQSLQLGQTLDEYTTHSPTSPATITTNRDSLSWQHNLSHANGLTTFGVDYWQDKAEKDDSGVIDETLQQHGLYAEHQWSGESSDVQVALRHDDHDSFGNATTGNIALGRQFDANSRGFISFGTAFKAPSVNALYWPYSADVFFGDTYITQGNPDLDPETSSTVELGLTQKFDGGSTRISLYRTWAEDLIDWLFTQTGPTEYNLQPENLDKVQIDGIELGIDWLIGQVRADFNLTLLDAENLTTGNQLDRRPKAEAMLTFSRHHRQYDWQLQWHLVGERLDLDGAVDMPAYGEVNASYRRKLDNGVELGLRVNNLFDQDYTLATTYSGQYAIPGRSAYLDLGYRF